MARPSPGTFNLLKDSRGQRRKGLISRYRDLQDDHREHHGGLFGAILLARDITTLDAKSDSFARS